MTVLMMMRWNPIVCSHRAQGIKEWFCGWILFSLLFVGGGNGSGGGGGGPH